MLHRLAASCLAFAALCLTAGAARAQTWSADTVRADLAQFRREFFEPDRAYSAPARQAAQARLALLDAQARELDPVRFGLALAQVAALADNGHTLSYGGPRLARSNRVGLRLAPFGRDFVVLRVRTADADLLGAALLAIDDVPLERLREAAHGLTGGLPSWRDRQAPLLLESPQQLQALDLVKDAAAARYRFLLADGRVIERRLVAEAPSPDRPRSDTSRLLLPDVVPETRDGTDTGWRSLLRAGAAPWSLQEGGRAFRWRHAPELAAVVIELRQTHDARESTLAAFFAEVRAAVQRHQPTHLVLDLRLNGGGDLTQARDFAESLPALVPGRIYALTSPWTFSAAISITGYLKQAAPARVRIVGEPVGDRLEFFAEGRPVTLAHSGEVLLPATERHDYRDGCRRFTDCHAPVVRRPIAVESLAPDLFAPWTPDAYRRGIDPAMDAVAADQASISSVSMSCTGRPVARAIASR
ncbi:hypothetical protein [Aquabacterium humicola]|uniref:hypothetical protein n=1 Tax=Aquabacterium humicola TaxID=3237377 RepID=UPI002543E671|nr:hypothetical protein [Rubrivivax pictus]